MVFEENIEKLANEIEDITEPSSMEKIHIYLEEIEKKDREFLELLEERTKDLEVYWDHPWYQDIQLYGLFIRVPQNDEQPFRTDSFTHEEHEKMEKNWIKFRRKFNVPDQLVSLTRFKHKNPYTFSHCRRFLTAYLGRGLERTLFDLFKYITNNICLEKKLKPYSVHELKIMEACFIHCTQTPISILSKILKRGTRALYNRLSQTVNGKRQYTRIKWNLQMATKLVKSLMAVTNLPLQELKSKKFDKEIWLKVEQEMDEYHVTLRQFWNCYLHVQLFVKYDVKINRLRRKILRHLKTSPYKVWSDIKWKEVLRNFSEGFTHIFLYRVVVTAVNKHDNYCHTPLSDLVEYGLQRIKSFKFRNKRLKTLAFNENNELEVVHYEQIYK